MFGIIMSVSVLCLTIYIITELISKFKDMKGGIDLMTDAIENMTFKENLNDFAVEITKREGKKKNVDIAQIKEILKITLEMLEEKGYIKR